MAQCFRRRGSFIESDAFATGRPEFRYQGLKVKERFKTPLGNLGLIRRVLGIPA